MADCKKYHEMISCLIDGELSPEDRASLDLHLTECEGCRALLNIYKLAFADDAVEPPAELVSGSMLRVRAEAAKNKRSFRKRVMRYVAVAASFAIIMFSVPTLTNLSSTTTPVTTAETTANSGCAGSYDPNKYDYLASVEIDGELPELLEGYTQTDKGDGSYTIEVRSYMLAYLDSLGYTPDYNSGSESDWSLVIYNPTATPTAA